MCPACPARQAPAEALKQNSSLRTIYLEGNVIGFAGAKALAETLKQNSSLTTISLSYNAIGADGAKALAEAAKENGSCKISPQDAIGSSKCNRRCGAS
ncbi:Nod1 [Symbiodinium microadriaticum]|nr:Nod1 [Symbiodinium microadriaticum]